MTKNECCSRVRAAASLAALLLALSVSPGRRSVLAGTLMESECEGDACAQVSVTFDEAKQQYRAVNNSPDRWARVTASNMAASASVCLAPGKQAYMALKTIAGPYRAAYAEPRCGEDAAAGPPAAE